MLSKRSSDARDLRDFVDALMVEQTQPLTIAEITQLVYLETRKLWDKSTIRLVCNDLLAEHKLLSRLETLSERKFRANGNVVRGSQSTLYFSSSRGLDHVPARSVVEAVSGVQLSAPKRRRAKRVPSYTPVAVQPQSDSIIAELVDRLVESRVNELQKELVETRDKLKVVTTALDELRGFLK